MAHAFDIVAHLLYIFLICMVFSHLYIRAMSVANTNGGCCDSTHKRVVVMLYKSEFVETSLQFSFRMSKSDNVNVSLIYLHPFKCPCAKSLFFLFFLSVFFYRSSSALHHWSST